MKKVEANGRTCNLGIWDTAGQERFDSPSSFYLLYLRWLYYCGSTYYGSTYQERFDSLSSFYCRGARAAIICFDLTDRASFEIIQTKWIKKVGRRSSPVVVVGVVV